MMRQILNKSNILRFIECYLVSQIFSIVSYAVPLIALAPIFGGTLIQKVSEYSDTHAHLQDPINRAISYYFCAAFFGCFIILYLYKNKELRLQFQKDTINECVLKKEFMNYMKQYGIMDLIYYTVCSIIVTVLLEGGMESTIFIAIKSGVVRIILSIFMFSIIYSISMLVILKIWDKNRPEYLKKGYIEKEY